MTDDQDPAPRDKSHSDPESSVATYPTHWEASVALRDGSTCLIRPITPADASRLTEFHSHLSAKSIYFRFFAPHPTLSRSEVERFTTVDYTDRVALVATIADEIVGVGRYDRTSDNEAEVAFTVRDDHQGRGLGSVLLEHLVAAARERGITRFTAEVLPGNRAMLSTFAMAGYRVAQELDDGVVRLSFDIEPTAAQRDIARARERRAEARSVERLFRPDSVVVIGASAQTDNYGRTVLRAMQEAGFAGSLYAVHPRAKELLGVRAFPSVAEVPGDIDLAVIVVPAEQVAEVVQECGTRGVHGLVVVSAGYEESGDDGLERQRELVKQVRGLGMRMIGPNALGIINTDARVRMAAAVIRQPPLRGRIGLFGQSASIALVMLDRLRSRRLGIASLLSVGNHADISSPDALQYWRSDPSTRVIAMYAETLRNPSKFVRVARDVSTEIPIVLLRSGRSVAYPLGSAVRRSTVPDHGISEILAEAGVIQADSVDQLVDLCALLSCQPLVRGRSLGIVGDSQHMVKLARDAAYRQGLRTADTGAPVDVVEPGMVRQRLLKAIRDPQVDAVLAVFVGPSAGYVEAVQRELLEVAAASTVPVIAVLSAESEKRLLVAPDSQDAAGPGSVPVFGTVEEAVAALAHTVRYRKWRTRPRGVVPELAETDKNTAVHAIDRVLTRSRVRRPESDLEQTVRMPGPRVNDLLEAYGIDLWPAVAVTTEDEAVAAADEVGWPVVLKSADPRLTRRLELGGVRLNLESEGQLRAAFLSMGAHLDAAAMSQVVVQRMAPSGVACALSTFEDPVIGPVVSFGMSGLAVDLLEDRSYRIPPITDLDAAALVRSPRASKLLFGYGGTPPTAVESLEYLLMRLGRLATELPQVARLDLTPIVVSAHAAAVLGARAWVRPAEARIDAEARRLTEL